MTLLLTNILAIVLFLLIAMSVLSVKMDVRNSSLFISGQCASKIALMALHIGPNLIGITSSAILVFCRLRLQPSCHVEILL